MHAQRLRRHGSLDANFKGPPPRGECSIEGCHGPAYCRTLCHGHYHRLQRGAPLAGPIRPRNAPTDVDKKCPSCGEVKLLTEFNRSKGKVTSWCKECLKYGRRKMFYGLTRDGYDQLVAAGCAVCGKTEGLVVDHHHGSGSVRGALCSNCNVALGMAGDDPARLRALAEYLER